MIDTSLTMLAAPFSIGDLTVNTEDADGVRILGDITEGWLGATDPTVSFVGRPYDHGSYSGESFGVQRVISLAGLIEAPTEELLFTALSRLNTAISLARTDFVAGYGGQLLICRVRRSAKVLITPVSPREVEWSAVVTADDPRRYSDIIAVDAIHTGETVTVTNEGDIRAPYFLTVTGLSHYPRIRHWTPANPGSFDLLAMSQSFVLAAQDRLVFDTGFNGNPTVYEYDHAGVRSPANRSNKLVTRSWSWLEPGDNFFQFFSTNPATFADDPDATLAVTARSAWQ